jgi:glycosyltransferase involved in cell wall biosynthesis
MSEVISGLANDDMQYPAGIGFQELRPLVTVIIPTCNSMRGGNGLDRCLESVFNQACGPLEVIIVDEGSIDRTLEVCARYPVRIFKSQGGRSRARNLGIVNAHGQFLMFLDSDMILDSQVVEECVEACLEEHFDGMQIVVRHEISRPGRIWDIAGARDVEYKAQNCRSDILFWVRNVVGEARFPEDRSLGEDLHFQSMLIARGALVGCTRSGLTHLYRSTMSEVLFRSYLYGKLCLKEKMFASLASLSRSVSVVGPRELVSIMKSLVRRRSIRLSITLPIYLLIKYTGFVLGFLSGIFEPFL